MTVETQELTRTFRYNSVDLIDPGTQYTPAEVRDFYAPTYPEILNAAIEGPEEKDGKLVYTFRRAVGTKGQRMKLRAPQPRRVEVPGTTGVFLIAAERQRQIEIEGYDRDHDDEEHTDGSLALAGACYAANAAVWAQHEGTRLDYKQTSSTFRWPWAEKHWKPQDQVRDLVRAGALIAAEIDRLLRLKAKRGH